MFLEPLLLCARCSVWISCVVSKPKQKSALAVWIALCSFTQLHVCQIMLCSDHKWQKLICWGHWIMHQRNCCGNGGHRFWSVKCLLENDYFLLPRFNTLTIRMTREWAQLKNKLRINSDADAWKGRSRFVWDRAAEVFLLQKKDVGFQDNFFSMSFLIPCNTEHIGNPLSNKKNPSQLSLDPHGSQTLYREQEEGVHDA